MPRWRRRAVAGTVALVAVIGACSQGHTESATPPAERTTSTTSTTAPSTTTSVTEPPAPSTTVAGLQSLAATTARVVASPTGVVVPVVGHQADAAVVTTPCDNTATLKRGTPLDGVVVLDAGHGGQHEPGSVGPNGLTEKALNLAVAGYTRDALRAQGLTVVMTRTGDYGMTLDARAAVVNALKPKAFVSIHHNAEPDGPFPKPGSETYYQTVGTSAAQSKRLAGLIYEEIVKALSQYQGIAWVADTDAGAKYRKGSTGDDYYGILRKTHGTPASLAELAFLTDPAEAALLARPDVEKVEGEAVARGIVRFLTTNDPGSGFTEPYPREEPAGGGGGKQGCDEPSLT